MTKAQHVKHAILVALAAVAPALIEILGPEGAFGHKAWAAPALAVVLWTVRAMNPSSGPPAAAALVLLLPFLGGAMCVKTPVTPTPADAGPSFVNCSDAAIHQAALNILPNVETAISQPNYEAAIASIIAGLVGPLAFDEVACAVQWVESKAEANAVTADSLEATKAANAKAWLAAHAVTFQ